MPPSTITEKHLPTFTQWTSAAARRLGAYKTSAAFGINGALVAGMLAAPSLIGAEPPIKTTGTNATPSSLEQMAKAAGEIAKDPAVAAELRRLDQKAKENRDYSALSKG